MINTDGENISRSFLNFSNKFKSILDILTNVFHQECNSHSLSVKNHYFSNLIRMKDPNKIV